jgi:serine/threonine protein kinase
MTGVASRSRQEHGRYGVGWAGMRAGEVFAGRFMLAERLGSGSMGEVWRATDRELDRVVAVKILQLAGGNPSRESVERFRREGKAIARLKHPHVARVYDVSDYEGRLFLVLELLTGPDLETLLKQHPGGLPVEGSRELRHSGRGGPDRRARGRSHPPGRQACEPDPR